MTKLEWWNYKDEIRILNVRMMKLKFGKVRIVKLKNWNGEIIIYCRV